MGTRAGPEWRLVLACARLHLQPHDDAIVAAALRENPDWGLVARLARWHGLRPLLQRHLAAVEPGLVPRPVLVELWGEAESIARHNHAMARELTRLSALLEARGIPALPFKGPALALAAYGDVALREFGDLDILVRRGDVMAAKRALGEAGYAPEHTFAPAIEAALLTARAQCHLVLRPAGAGPVVELHWKTDADFAVERTDDPAWWEALERAPGEGAAVRAFRPEELMLVLCLHGSKHHWSSLGWLVDVAELLRRGPGLDWDAIARRAGALGCRRRVGVGLALARSLLDAPWPGEARSLVDFPGVAALAQRLAVASATPELAAPGPLGGLRLNLALHERAADRIRLVLDTLFMPSLVEWTRWPLPRTLFFLYPALRMGRLAAKHACPQGVRREAGVANANVSVPPPKSF